jgi:hypothetical protein
MQRPPGPQSFQPGGAGVKFDSSVFPLVEIPRKEWLLKTTESFPCFGGYCHIVISEKYLGWYPFLIYKPVFFPKQFHVIPVTAIKGAQFTGNWLQRSIRIITSSDGISFESLEGEIRLPYMWLKPFNDLGIPILNSELGGLTSFRGLIFNYSPFFLGLAAIGLMAIGIIVAFRVPAARPVITILVALVIPVGATLTRILRALLRNRSASNDPD